MEPRTSIQIVTLPPSEWAAYKDIRLAALHDEPQAFGSTYADMVTRPDSFWQTRLQDAAEGKGQWLFFARENGRLVGITGAFLDPDNPREARVVSVFVRRDARGRGVAKALMTAILGQLKAAGIAVARLGVNTEQEAAVHLYQSCGFRVISTDRELLGDGKYYDAWEMEKKL